MRTISRIITTVALAGLLTVGIVPAAYAVDPPQIPADCTLAPAGTDGLTLTCTARPPTQTWHLGIYCTYWTHPSLVHGNNVTGNGTSEKHCLLGYEPDGGIFIINS